MSEKRYLYKRTNLFDLVDKIKLWAARSGILHGVKSAVLRGDTIEVETHCNEHFIVRNSKNSRSARYLRNRFCTAPCEKCGIPDWKLKKYSATVFTDNAMNIRK
jgi:pyrrolysyl-tRNA synthetase-like protein